MKKILITGAGSGLGRGTAIGLAQAGHQVTATTQIWPQVTQLRNQVEELGLTGQITVDKLDVLDPRDRQKAARWDFDTFVSNAGTGDGGPMQRSPSTWSGARSRRTCSPTWPSPSRSSASSSTPAPPAGS